MVIALPIGELLSAGDPDFELVPGHNLGEPESTLQCGWNSSAGFRVRRNAEIGIANREYHPWHTPILFFGNAVYMTSSM